MQRRVDTHALVEDETLPAIVRPAAVLEVLEDAAFQLQHIAKALRLHVGAGLLAADAARAEHDDGLVLELLRQLRHCGGKVPEMIHARGQRVLERAELHFVVIAGVEQRERPALVEPGFQLTRSELRRGTRGRIDSRHAEGDDFLLDAYQHATEGLFGGAAVFRLQLCKAGNAPKSGQHCLDPFGAAGDEQVDAFPAQENRAPQLV